MSLEGSQISRFHLLRLLKRGGMGEVYLAEDSQLQRQVAIKVVQDENPNAGSARLFQREARAIAMLDHPHILPLFDFGEVIIYGTPLTYMVMPFCKDDTLASWIQQHRNTTQISLHEIVSIIQQAASALQYAHNRQIVHQDVKPSNLLIRSSEDASGPPDLLLADFGVAKSLSATSTLSQSVRGTPAYMAPEQWEGTPVSATDQYALAVLAYDLLTGHPPFQGGMGQIMYQHMHVIPQPPSTLNPRIPADVDTVILHALAKKPEERFGSISAFARAFEQALLTNNSGPTGINNNSANIARVNDNIPSTDRVNDNSSSPTSVTNNNANFTSVNNLPEPNKHDIRAELVISETEAQEGTRRILTLPSGQEVPVTIPAGTVNGQVLHFEKQVKPTREDDSPGALILTITTAPPSKPIFLSSTSNDETVIDNNPVTEANGGRALTPPSLPTTVDKKAPQSRPKGKRGATILLLILAILIAGGGGLGFFLVTRNNQSYNPYPTYRNLTLDDPLSDNSQNHKWSEVANSCTFTGGAYHVNTQANSSAGCVSSNLDFKDYAYEVQMTIVKGDGGGILFRYDSTNAAGYYFTIYQNGNYDGGIFSNCSTSTTCQTSEHQAGASPAIHTGLNQSNLIAVVVSGHSITAYVNNQKVLSGSDSTYSHGSIGVSASNVSTPTEVVFSNAKVWI